MIGTMLKYHSIEVNGGVMVELVTAQSYPCILGFGGLPPRRGGPRAECGCWGTSGGLHKW